MNFLPVVGAEPAAPGSFEALTESATEMLTWFISSMGDLLGFILDQPAILMMFMILLVGSAVGMLFRVWHSA